MNPSPRADLPFVRSFDWSTAPEGRFARTLTRSEPEGCRIGLFGVPDDTGVAMNRGRVGAADGPRAFREALARYGTTHHAGLQADLAEVGVFDFGDVPPADSLDATHDAVTRAASAILDRGLLPVMIGGGHDLTWPFVRAVAARHPRLAGVFFDAHLDVREEAGSGMPFRKILSETTCGELRVVGLDPFANRQDHVAWFLAHGGRIEGESTFPSLDADHAFVSFDLDAIGAAEAPGVSAINPVGLSVHEADAAAFAAGAHDRVRSFDIMELNPRFDADGRTARLAARLFLSFLAGFSTRAA